MKNATKKASEIIRELWDYDGKPTQEFNIDGKIIKTNFCAYHNTYWNGNDVPEKYTGAKNGIHYNVYKLTSEELDDCIAEGFDEIRFVLCASGMIRGYCDVFVWAHKSSDKKAKEDSNMKFNKIEAGCYGAENGMLIKKGWAGLWRVFFNDNQLTVCETLKEAKGWIEEHERETHMLENMKAQELTEKPQESSEPVAQEIIQPEPEDATESISEAQRDNRWNVSVFFSKGQILDELFRLKNDLSSGDIVGCTKRHEHQMNRFIKALDVAIDCINEIDELSQKASQSSSDEEKEIAQENPQELTESNPEPLGDIKLSDFFSITEMLLMENSEPEWAYYHNNDLIWASSKRFSKDELLRMYANGYFMPYLTDKRKNLSRIQLKEYKTMGNTERCQNLWKQIEALDEEIARLFMNGARM